jgi:hypothetical protein
LPDPFPFIVGNPRSGTTLLRALLDSHPEMAVPPESYFVVTLAHLRELYETDDGLQIDSFVDDLLSHRRFKRWDVPKRELRDALARSAPGSYPDAIRAVYALYAARQGKRRYADKTPKYVEDLSLLTALFPESLFVHIVRDGRDVAMSYLEVDWGPNSVVEAARRWRRRVGLGRQAGAELGPARYTEVRYEDLVGDPERELRRVCDFIALDFDAQMFRYVDRAEDFIAPHFHPEAHQGMNRPPTEGMRDWRTQMAADDVAKFELVAGDLLAELGYERRTDGDPDALRDVDLRPDLEDLMAEVTALKGRVDRLTRRRALADRRRLDAERAVERERHHSSALERGLWRARGQRKQLRRRLRAVTRTRWWRLRRAAAPIAGPVRRAARALGRRARGQAPRTRER